MNWCALFKFVRHENLPERCPWFPCGSGQSVVGHVAGHVGHEGLPLGIKDGCRGSLGCDLIEAVGLLVGALIAESAELFLVFIPRHVVFAPTPGTSLDFLFMCFPFLGRCLLPVFIFLLYLLVGVVLLVLLFPVVPSPCFLPPALSSSLAPAALFRLGASWNWPLRAVSSACMATILSSSGDLAPHIPSCFNRLSLFIANMMSFSCVRVSVPSV